MACTVPAEINGLSAYYQLLAPSRSHIHKEKNECMCRTAKVVRKLTHPAPIAESRIIIIDPPKEQPFGENQVKPLLAGNLCFVSDLILSTGKGTKAACCCITILETPDRPAQTA
jgi:hypothetical protein